MKSILLHTKEFVQKERWCLAFIPIFFIFLFLITQPRLHKGVIKNNEFTYTGTLINGQPEGTGKMIYKNGDTYNGNFNSGKFNSKGTFSSHNGNWTYSGYFKNGEANGDGVMTISGKSQAVKMRNGIIIK